MKEKSTLVINEVSRRTVEGNVEALQLSAGVNIIVGDPNTGKTKWLETIDYLLGDTGDDPYAVADDDALTDKYEAAGLRFTVGGKNHYVERRWREQGGKGRILLDDEALSTKEYQHFLMRKLNFPILSVPSGNPYSGRTWPELSFRSLLRHFYRQQGLWLSLVDKQPDDTFRGAVQLFLGLAEHLYTEDYEEIIRLRNEIQHLRSRRDQFSDTLTDIAKGFLDEDALTLSVTLASLDASVVALEKNYEEALAKRERVLGGAVADSLTGARRSWTIELTVARAGLVAALVPAREELSRAEERLGELQAYKKMLSDEADRFGRAESASKILSDLRVTHCPACNQSVKGHNDGASTCFLCHQSTASLNVPEELAKQRVDYERARLEAELSEAAELIPKAEDRVSGARKSVESIEAKIQDADRALEPARQQLSALVQEPVSELDKYLGSLSERLKQVRRLSKLYLEKRHLDDQISDHEQKLRPILDRNSALAEGLDYSGCATLLEDGMNDYLTALNQEQPGTWRHQAVDINLSQSSVSFRVGNRRWDVSLGGTDSLYYLMAYHYGLMTLTAQANSHFPGFTMIDFPAEFAGTKIGDAEDFVVQPFINLLEQDEFEGCQLILTGAAFSGLKGVNRIELREPYIT